MESQEIRTIDLIRNHDLLNSNTVDILRRQLIRYPYYQTLRLLLLENLYKIHSPEFNDELRRSSLLLADRSVLFNLVEGVNYEIEPQVSEEELHNHNDEDRTLSLIDSYLDNRPIEKINRKISSADAAQDYASYLMQIDDDEGKNPYRVEGLELEDDAPKKNNSARRENSSRSVLQHKPDEDLETPSEEELPREEFFTETLAQIYIKQHKYERALEIIKALSLNNPKKNAYFADQIRFLEKLIAINKSKKTDNV